MISIFNQVQNWDRDVAMRPTLRMGTGSIPVSTGTSSWERLLPAEPRRFPHDVIELEERLRREQLRKRPAHPPVPAIEAPEF
jgi:hypothetical protein